MKVLVKECFDAAAPVVTLDHSLALEGRVEKFIFTAVGSQLVEIPVVELSQIELFVDLLQNCHMAVLGILSLKFRIQLLIFKTPENRLVLPIDVLRLNLEIHPIIFFSVDIVVSNFKYGHRRHKNQGFDTENCELVTPPDDLPQSSHIGDSYQ